MIDAGLKQRPDEPPAPLRNYAGKIAAAEAALKQLRDYLLTVPDDLDWDGITSQSPQHARAAIRSIPVAQRPPGWVSLLEILDAPLMRYSSADRRDRILRLLPGANLL